MDFIRVPKIAQEVKFTYCAGWGIGKHVRDYVTPLIIDPVLINTADISHVVPDMYCPGLREDVKIPLSNAGERWFRKEPCVQVRLRTGHHFRVQMDFEEFQALLGEAVNIRS